MKCGRRRCYRAVGDCERRRNGIQCVCKDNDRIQDRKNGTENKDMIIRLYLQFLFGLICFYGTSTIVIYFMPNLFLFISWA